LSYNSGPLFLFVGILSFQALSWLKRIMIEEEEELEPVFKGHEDYFDALEPTDKAVNIGSELYYLDKYKTRTFGEEQFERLQQSGRADLEKIIIGTGTYRMLDNLRYQ
jgi:hypothetical protein